MSCAAAASSSRPSASNGVTIAVMTPPMALMLRRPFSLDRLERVGRLLGRRGRRRGRRLRCRGCGRRGRRRRGGVLGGWLRSARGRRWRRLTLGTGLLPRPLGLLLVDLGLLLLELLLGLLGRFLGLYGRLLGRLLSLVQKPHLTSPVAGPDDRPRAYPLGPAPADEGGVAR